MMATTSIMTENITTLTFPKDFFRAEMPCSIAQARCRFTSNHTTLQGQSIVVTAPATDLGHAVCLALAAKGAIIVMLERKQRLMLPLYDQICAQGGEEPLMIAMDTATAAPAHFEQLSQRLGQSCNAIDGLLHLDMLSAPLSPTALSDPNHWDASYQQALIQPMLLTKSMLPLLGNSSNASVVFATFPAGRSGRAYWGAVGAAYAALENFSESMACEHDNIRFNTIDPGKVNTAIRRQYYPAEARSALRAYDDPVLMENFVFLFAVASQQLSGNRYTAE